MEAGISVFGWGHTKNELLRIPLYLQWNSQPIGSVGALNPCLAPRLIKTPLLPYLPLNLTSPLPLRLAQIR